jgi:2,3-bisphosphoglycerate-dependent phosphoglycerate mutase
MRLFVLARHAHSSLNEEGKVNGDPSVPVALTELGKREAERLGHEVANVALELVVHTRFGRTLETAKLALGDRSVPLVEEPLLDDVDVGDLEGRSIADYREWKRHHARSDPFPAGESLDDAARRYARGLRALLARDESAMLVVCHEIPIRYALNAAAGSGDLDGPEHAVPNATPYLFDERALARAADGIERIVA